MWIDPTKESRASTPPEERQVYFLIICGRKHFEFKKKITSLVFVLLITWIEAALLGIKGGDFICTSKTKTIPLTQIISNKILKWQSFSCGSAICCSRFHGDIHSWEAGVESEQGFPFLKPGRIARGLKRSEHTEQHPRKSAEQHPHTVKRFSAQLFPDEEGWCFQTY